MNRVNKQEKDGLDFLLGIFTIFVCIIFFSPLLAYLLGLAWRTFKAGAGW